MCDKLTRFADVEFDSKPLAPIYGYWSHPLVSLDEALKPISPLIPQLDRYVKTAKGHCIYPSDHGLTRDESAALYLYTMEWGKESFYRVLNRALRSEDRSSLKPWFAFLKLFDTALGKLPNVRKVIWRGVRNDISKKFKNDQEYTWWSVNSCSASVHVVKNFLANNSTLFLIEAENGKDISNLTNYPNEDEVLLGPGTKLRVVGDALDHAGGLHVVHLREVTEQNEEKNNKDIPIKCGTTNEKPTTRNILEMAYSKLASAAQIDLSRMRKSIVPKPMRCDSPTKEEEGTIICYPTGDSYQGSLKDNKKHGHGSYFFVNGNHYVGEWNNDVIHGKGVFTWSNGNRYEGNYKNGKMQGQGTFFFINGEKYVGEWTDNMRNGRGTYSWPNGNYYEGEHKDNMFHGRGKEVSYDGRVRKGQWKNNVFMD